jgi:DNA-binding response OmpR family regulator/thioredoxin-like negative regulator of GroEL
MASRESPYKNLKFLIIDDFPAMCKQIERILNSAGAEAIDIVYNGEKALLACSKQKYDVIFADFNLGAGKNGQQLLEELRHRKLIKSTCAYIMITAEATKDFVFGALEFAPDIYLNKPFNQAELLQRLQRIVVEKQAIGPVLMAQEAGNIDLAIELCIAGIQSDPKRRTIYMKMLGEFYLRTGKYEKAKGVFDQVLSVRELDWAKLGKARCHFELQEYDQATSILAPMTAHNTPHMEAYDLMAGIAAKRGDNRGVQAVLEHAVSVSPRSVKRQKQLANVAEENNDLLAAESAHKSAMKSSEHSMHEGPNMYLDYANSVNKVMTIQGPENGDRFKESQRVLSKVKQKFRDPIVTMRVDMAASTANKLTGNEAEAKALMEKVTSDYALLEGQMGASIGPESRLEFANLLIDNGQQEQAQEVLKALAADYPDDEVLCKKIDRASSEPLSQLGKAAAIKLNREGKQLLQEKNFADAVVLFSQALDLYPNNIGLKLNLVLAHVQKMQVDGRSAEVAQLCRDILTSVGELSSDSEFFKLYHTLKQSL